MTETEKIAATIAQLEDQRFTAIVAQDFESFIATAHPELLYTHSNGNTDSLESYMKKCREGFYVYHSIDHPITKILVTGDVALVLGQMNADITAGGTRKHLKNNSLAVWVKEGEEWKFLAYQPTPRP